MKSSAGIESILSQFVLTVYFSVTNYDVHICENYNLSSIQQKNNLGNCNIAIEIFVVYNE